MGVGTLKPRNRTPPTVVSTWSRVARIEVSRSWIDCPGFPSISTGNVVSWPAAGASGKGSKRSLRCSIEVIRAHPLFYLFISQAEGVGDPGNRQRWLRLLSAEI